MTTPRRRKRGGGNTSSPSSQELPELDPILPLPAHTEVPVVHQGDGDTILNDTRMMVVELPYRAFYALWDYAERRAAKIYPQYINRTDGMEKGALAALEAVHAFRSSFRGEVLPMMNEADARAARLERKRIEEEAAAKKSKKKTGESSTATAVSEDSISETSEPTPRRKTRCREVFDGEPGDQCLGPEEHSGRHKDKYGNRWSTE